MNYLNKRFIDIQVQNFLNGDFDLITIKDGHYISKKQIELFEAMMDSVIEFVGYGGAAFGGKSSGATLFATLLCWAFDGIGIGLGRRELKNLKRTTLVTLFNCLKDNELIDGQDYKYNGQDQIITFSNGSQIILIDTAYRPSDPLYTRFGGYELTGCIIDESNETEHKAIEILYTRTGRRLNKKYGLKRKVLETFNPDKGHVHRRYYEPNKNGTLKESYIFIPALPKDNPSPEAEEYVRGIIENASEITVQRLIYGNFDYDDSKDVLHDHESILNAYSNEYAETGKRALIADVAFGGEDKTAVWLKDGLRYTIKRVIEKKEFIGKDANKYNAKIIKAIAKSEKIPVQDILVDAGGLAGVHSIIGCKGFNGATKATKTKYKNLKTECAYVFADFLNQNLISIDAGDYKDELTKDFDCVRRAKMDSDDGKLYINTKDEQKRLRTQSPDYYDGLLMSAIFLDDSLLSALGTNYYTFNPETMVAEKEIAGDLYLTIKSQDGFSVHGLVSVVGETIQHIDNYSAATMEELIESVLEDYEPIVLFFSNASRKGKDWEGSIAEYSKLKKFVDGRAEVVQTSLTYDQVKRVRVRSNEYYDNGLITVSGNCKELIREKMNLKQTHDGFKDGGGITDCEDALIRKIYGPSL